MTAEPTSPFTFCWRCESIITLGRWPWCPHGVTTLVVEPDSYRGGLTIENLGPEPVTVYSRSEHEALIRARGLQRFERHVGLPGSDKSPYSTRWI